ncbi:MAG: GDSL-type esterase/lipase family protein [Proteobacteria bacterium]|nr:GDSL-type esterase/lipase family protein [Pseudomonadota bacterium]
MKKTLHYKLSVRLLYAGLAASVFALLSLQALAQSALDPTRFENRIKTFEAADHQNPPPKGAIVLTGSSSIALWNDQAQAALAPLTVISRGFGGSVMADVLHYIDRVAIAYEPRAIVIYGGDNDTAYGIPLEVIVSQFEQTVAKIHKALPATRIYVLSVKPSVLRKEVWGNAVELNKRLQNVAHHDPLVYYVDVATSLLNDDGTVMTDIFVADNLHLNDLGNSIWGASIKAALMPREARHEYVTLNGSLPPTAIVNVNGTVDHQHISALVSPPANVYGIIGSLFVAVALPENKGETIYFIKSSGAWVPFTSCSNAHAYQHGQLFSNMAVSVFSKPIDFRPYLGMSVYAGYGTGYTWEKACSNMLLNNSFAKIHTVI